jgi:hypothetical protein
MTSAMRAPTLQTMGLGSVIDIFRQGRLPVDTAELVDTVFGKGQDRGCLVISGPGTRRGVRRGASGRDHGECSPAHV